MVHNTEDKDNYIGVSRNQLSEEGDLLSGFDFDKALRVVKQSIPWALVIMMITCTGAYLYLRYSKPLYESVSDLKLDIKSDASLLGISKPATTFNNLSGEIELIRSKLFFNKVVAAVNFDITYHFVGNLLNEERYLNCPFEVTYSNLHSSFYDKRINVEIINAETYKLSYQHWGKEYSQTHRFGELVSSPEYQLNLQLTQHFDPAESRGVYFFTINSEQSQASYIGNNFDVKPLNFNARTIRVSFRDHTRRKAADVVQAIDTLYLNYTKEEKIKATRQQISFIDKQLKQTEAKLEEFEDYFENFTINNKTTNLNDDISKTIEAIAKIEQQRFELTSALVKVNTMVDAIREDKPVPTLFGTDYLTINNLQSMLNEYNELLTDKELLLAAYKENTLVVSKKNTEIQLLKNNLLDKVYELKSSLTIELSDYEKQKRELESTFKSLPSLGTEYTKNRRNYSLYEGFYLTQLQTKAEFEIAQAGTVTNFAILTPPTYPSAPIYPKRLFVYAIGITAGLVLSLLLIGARYLLHNKIGSQAELEKLSLAPLLGIVPYYSLEKMPSTKLVVNKYPKSSISESLRSVRTNMEFLSAAKKKKIISITSTVSGEGKTFIAVNLGAIIAFSKLKVILVDLDMRKPKIHSAFNNENSPQGVSTILINKHGLEESIETTDLEHLHYICAGPTPPNPSELLLSQEFDAFLDKLKGMYDLIILDTPPVGLVTDGILAMKKSDIPIYVIRADYSRKTFVSNLNRLIRINKFNNLTTILNSVKAPGVSKYYGNSYGYGNYYVDTKPKSNIFAKLFRKS